MKKLFSILLALFLFCTPVVASDLYPALGALTGGGTGALDKIDGAGLSDGDAAIAILSSGSYHYHLNATSGASENSPYVIAPDTNPGTKRWILVIPSGPFSHVRALTSVAQSIPNSSGTTVIFGTENEDSLGEYNNATGVFTATYAGHYVINTAIKFASASWTVGEVIVPILNFSVGSDLQSFVEIWASRTGNAIAGISIGVTLAAGETVEFQLYQTQGGAVALSGEGAYNWLSIDRIP